MADVPNEGHSEPESEADPASLRARVFELWLEHGWSPPKIAGRAVAAVTVAIPVYGYVTHRGSPGAVWWLVGALSVAFFWAMTDALRWRIRHSRLDAAHSRRQQELDDERSAHSVTRENLVSEERSHAQARIALRTLKGEPVDDRHREQIRRIARRRGFHRRMGAVPI